MPQPASITNWRPSLRMRLTLWMMLVFLFVQVFLVVVLHIYERQSINEFFHERLRRRHELIVQELHLVLPDISDVKLQEVASHHRRLLTLRNFVVSVYDASGHQIATTHPPHERLPDDVWQSVRELSSPRVLDIPLHALHVADADGMSSVVGWTPAGGTRFLVIVAWSDMYAAEMRRRLSGAIFIMIPIGLVSLMVSAYAISGIAEEPFRAIRLLARGLEPEFLGREVPAVSGGQEVKDLQRDLESTRTKLETAFKSQERFMSNVSHELKTPISVMITEAQALRTAGAPGEVKSFVASVVEELTKLGRMVDSFLMLTRIHHGAGRIPNREMCTVRDIILSSYEGCVAMASQHRVRVKVTLPEADQVDAAVHGNCDLLRTVIDNLLRNAIRFSPAGFTVDVAAIVRGNKVYISVRDYGPGIPNDLLPRIFDRFSQSTEEQRRGRGNGLGLQIAMGITELHGGTINVRNVESGGCEFEVMLPLCPPPQK